MKLDLQLFAGGTKFGGKTYPLYIYSNDGKTLLYSNDDVGGTSVIVNSTGCSYNNNQLYTYSGSGTFMGFTTSANSQIVTYDIGDTISNAADATIYIVEQSGTTYEHILKNGNKVQVDSAIRDGNGVKIDTNYSLKSATVSNVSYDSSSKKLQQTKNGTTSDVVTFGANAFNSTTIPTSYVSSVNGSTGAVTNIATTDTSQTISGYKTFDNNFSFNSGKGIVYSGDGKLASANAIFRFGTTSDGNAVMVLANATSTKYLRPGTNGDMNLGVSAQKWKDLYISGKAYIPKLNNGADISVPTTSGTLALTSDVPSVWSGTQAQYDAIANKDSNTYYFIEEE